MCFSWVVKHVSPFGISESTALSDLILYAIGCLEIRLPLFVKNYSDAWRISEVKEKRQFLSFCTCATFWNFSCVISLLLQLVEFIVRDRSHEWSYKELSFVVLEVYGVPLECCLILPLEAVMYEIRPIKWFCQVFHRVLIVHLSGGKAPLQWNVEL